MKKDSNMVVPGENTLTYNSYLKVHELLDLQNVLSNPPEHDETLFIIIHQVYELWFKQILHEFDMVLKYLENDESFLLLKTLQRIDKIQNLLVDQVDILETMTPNEFNYFREKLNPASGFQSHQFRILEFKLGLKNPMYFKFYEHDPKAKQLLEKAMMEDTIYDHFLRFFKRKGINVPDAVLSRDVSQVYEENEDLAKEIAKIYQNPSQTSELYQILEKLMDFDQKLLRWRYRHVQMVQRVIGITMGTGGSMGVNYLKTTLTKKAFPEIWSARKYIIDHLG
ncbi:MAG: tryptophan 2,3-dioxygenase [Bdellovibrionales bacterium]